MHDWRPVEKQLDLNPHSKYKVQQDVHYFEPDFKCAICGLTKYKTSDESKLQTCEEYICRAVLEEEVISFSATENIGIAAFNPRGLTKLKL